MLQRQRIVPAYNRVATFGRYIRLPYVIASAQLRIDFDEQDVFSGIPIVDQDFRIICTSRSGFFYGIGFER
jgi:hypothetical protein